MARTAQESLSFYFTARQGRAGNLMAVVGLASPKDEAHFKKVADGLLASAQLGTPQAEAWKRELGGVLLTLKSRDCRSAIFSSNTESYMFCFNEHSGTWTLAANIISTFCTWKPARAKASSTCCG